MVFYKKINGRIIVKNLSEELQTYKENPGELYSRGFFKDILKAKRWQLPLGKKIAELYGFESVVDFGCASGYYLEGFHQGGAKIRGFEYLLENSIDFMSDAIKPYVEQGNVMENIDCGKFDLSMSIEVAEHILPEKSDVFVTNLVNASNKYILLTAAPPGQGGTGHINEQPKEFWIDKIEAYGFKFSTEGVKKIQASFIKVPSTTKYTRLIRRQIMFFVKGD